MPLAQHQCPYYISTYAFECLRAMSENGFHQLLTRFGVVQAKLVEGHRNFDHVGLLLISCFVAQKLYIHLDKLMQKKIW